MELKDTGETIPAKDAYALIQKLEDEIYQLQQENEKLKKEKKKHEHAIYYDSSYVYNILFHPCFGYEPNYNAISDLLMAIIEDDDLEYIKEIDGKINRYENIWNSFGDMGISTAESFNHHHIVQYIKERMSS